MTVERSFRRTGLFFPILLLTSSVYVGAALSTTISVRENAGSAQLSVGLGSPCENQNGCSIDYATADDTATAGEDYQSASGTLAWSLGDRSPRTITVVVNDDSVMEATEQLRVVYSRPVGVELFDPDTIRIVDDDTPPNEPPQGVDDAATTAIATPVTVAVLANDRDPDNGPQPLRLQSIAEPPANGTATANSDGSITYTPNAGFIDDDTLVYVVSDGLDTDTARLTVTVVNAAPDAVDDSAATPFDTAVTIDVLANDSDADGPQPLRITSVSEPRNGTATAADDGAVTYTPDVGFSGQDTFGYTVTDGDRTDTATVVVSVAGPGNRAPVPADDAAATSAGAAISIDVLANDVDPDGDPLTVVSVSPPANGSAAVVGGAISYTPPATVAETVDVRFAYAVSDGVATASAQVTVTVSPAAPVNLPPTTVNDAATTVPGTPITINVLANDTDPNGDTLNVVSASSPELGSAAVNRNGTITYTPPVRLDAPATTTFSYTVSDGTFVSTSTVTITIELLANSPPDGTIDAPGGSVTIGAGGSLEFSGSGTDPDGDLPLRFQWQFEGGTPASAATANPGAVRFANPGTFTVTLTVSDARGLADPQPATLTVEVLPDAPADARLQALGPTVRVVDLNDAVELSVRLSDDAGGARAGVLVDWSVERLSSAAIGNGGLSERRSGTDADGVAATTLNTGSIPERYRVVATLAGAAGGDSVQFTVVAGTEGTVAERTPEAAAGRAVDHVCPQLNVAQGAGVPLTDGQNDLLDRCNALVAASVAGEGSDVAVALRQISPAEASLQGRTSQLTAAQQLGNIGSRLSALRRGSTGFDLAGLNFDVNGTALPGVVFQQVLTAGGGAGDDEAGDPFSRLGVFASGTAVLGERDRTSQEEGFDFDTLGITVGADYRFSDEVTFGMALGYANTGGDVDGDGGSFDADTVTIAAYGNYYVSENVYIDAILSYGRGDYRLDRNIRYQVSRDPLGQITRTARGDTDSSQLGASVGAGYQFNFDSGYSVFVDGRLSYVDADIDGYQERGADGLNLIVDEQNWTSLSFTLGGEISRALSFDWGVLIPRARVEWEYEFETDPENIAFRFANALDDRNFEFEVEEPDASYFRIGGGFNALFSAGRSLFFSADTTLGRDHDSEYSFTLGGRFEF